MRRFVFGCLTALMVVTLPRCLAAEDGKHPDRGGPQARPERPNPDALFNRLDVKHQGFIRLDKLPSGTPERLKEFLKRADVNKDGKVTREEFKKAIEARHHGSHPAAGPQHHQQAAQACAGPGKPCGAKVAAKGQCPCGAKTAAKGQCPCGAKMAAKGQCPCGAKMAAKGQCPCGAKMAAKGPGPGGLKLPLDARAIFNKLDKNHDGKLSFEEFAVGVRHLNQLLAQRAQAMRSFLGRQGPNVTMQRGPERFARGPQERDGMRGHFAQRDGFQPGAQFWIQRGGNFAYVQRGGFDGGPRWGHDFDGCPQQMGGREGFGGRGPMPGPCWMANFQGHCHHHHHHHGMGGFDGPWHQHGMDGYAGGWQHHGMDGYAGGKCHHGMQHHGMGSFYAGGHCQSQSGFGGHHGFQGQAFGGRGFGGPGFGGPMMHPGFAGGFGGQHPQWGGRVAEGWTETGAYTWHPGMMADREGPRGPQAAEGHKHHKHDGQKAGKHDGQKAGKHDGQKAGHPGDKWQSHPQPARAEGRADDQRLDSIEARLAALEEQQAATLAMVQEEHTAVMAALEKTNELLTVKLAEIDQMQERMTASYGHPEHQRGVREVARAQRNAPPRDRGWDDDEDRD